MHEPSIKPFAMRYFNTAGVPPTLCTSSMTYFPLGFKSAINGVLSLTAWKSSKVKVIPHACAIAIKCNTAFVLPPRAITMVIAFSKAALVMISLGFKSIFNKCLIAFPAKKHSSIFNGSSAGIVLEYGNVIPEASIADAMVFAVYIPPHAPAPGHEFLTISFLSSSVIASVTN